MVLRQEAPLPRLTCVSNLRQEISTEVPEDEMSDAPDTNAAGLPSGDRKEEDVQGFSNATLGFYEFYRKNTTNDEQEAFCKRKLWACMAYNWRQWTYQNVQNLATWTDAERIAHAPRWLPNRIPWDGCCLCCSRSITICAAASDLRDFEHAADQRRFLRGLAPQLPRRLDGCVALGTF